MPGKVPELLSVPVIEEKTGHRQPLADFPSHRLFGLLHVLLPVEGLHDKGLSVFISQISEISLKSLYIGLQPVDSSRSWLQVGLHLHAEVLVVLLCEMAHIPRVKTCHPSSQGQVNAGIAGCGRPAAANVHDDIGEPVLVPAVGPLDLKIIQMSFHSRSSLHLFYKILSKFFIISCSLSLYLSPILETTKRNTVFSEF